MTEDFDITAGADFLLRTRTGGPGRIQAGDLLGVHKQSTAEDGQVVVAKLGENWMLDTAPVGEGFEIQGRVVWFRGEL